MRFVLDCSVTLPWFFEDQDSPYAMSILDSLQHAEAIVPPLWTLEVGNGLLSAERRQRLTRDESNEALGLLRELNIRVDEQPEVDRLLSIAREHDLTVYDAAYLELALRRKLPIATGDQRLIMSAERAQVLLYTPAVHQTEQ